MRVKSTTAIPHHSHAIPQFTKFQGLLDHKQKSAYRRLSLGTPQISKSYQNQLRTAMSGSFFFR